jgi:hypothetical protein
VLLCCSAAVTLVLQCCRAAVTTKTLVALFFYGKTAELQHRNTFFTRYRRFEFHSILLGKISIIIVRATKLLQ